MNIAKLYEFDPIIYPYKLWIRVGSNSLFKDIEEQFLDYEGNAIEGLKSDASKLQALTMPVMARNLSTYGVLICFRSKKELSNYELVAHECSHATKYLCAHTGIDLNVHEPSEYIIGWMAHCCMKIRQDKVLPKS